MARLKFLFGPTKGRRDSVRRRAFPGHGISDVLFKERGQQVGVTLEHRPEHGQQPLVRQQRLPGGFQKQATRALDMVGIIVKKQIFPRVQLEQNGNPTAFVVKKLAVVAQSDLFEVAVVRPKTRFPRGPAHGFDRPVIFGIPGNGGEMQVASGLKDLAKPRDQRLVYAVELVRTFRQHTRRQLIFQPLPLKGGALVKRGRRVGVVFQQLGGAFAVIGEIEPAIDLGITAFPAVCNKIAMGLRNP